MDALERAGCDQVYEDKASGASAGRKGLADALDWAREAYTLVVWKPDRLGRSLKHLVETVTALNTRGVGFVSLHEQIDIKTPGGQLVFHVFCAVAEFERDLVRERTQAGLKAARARERQGEGPPKLGAEQVAMARRLLSDSATSVSAVCRTLKVGRTTLYPHLTKRLPNKL